MITKHSIISILGGSGFIGGHILKHLASTGARIKIIARNAESRGKNLKVAGYVGQISFINCDIHDTRKLEECIKGSDILINCIGLLFSKGKQNFSYVHHKFLHNLVGICERQNIKKILHFSALGVDKVLTAEYSKTKLLGEKEIINSSLNYTIFRPSVVFGPEDNFINLFAKIAKFSPVLPLFGGGHTKLQPIYVDDLAQAVLNALTIKSQISKNSCFEVAGPNVYEMHEIMDIILNATHLKRLKINIPFVLAKFQALLFELLPSPLLTRDQVELLRYDNILIGKNDLKALGVTPKSLESVISSYIA